MAKKPWQGRFDKDTSLLMENFSQSVSFDSRLYAHDIRGSIAHARMLGERGIIPREDSERIIHGLQEILVRIEEDRFSWDPSLEDVHMNIEARLTENVGQAGARLHTARSRNDQVALDLRLFVRDQCGTMRARLAALMEALLEQAGRNRDAVLPGYTHLQRAQPVLLAHHLLAYFEMFRRDEERFAAVHGSAGSSPLGSGALAGTPHPIDRLGPAAELGFEKITRNSMDAVSDRDFAAEFLFAAALCQIHLSRLGEEIILWSSSEFGFVDLPDGLCTGSSMMPQKKNPDAAELIRGKSGRVVGNLVSLLVTLKGLPMTYNRDLQEDKEPLFDSADTLSSCLQVMDAIVRGAAFRAERMMDAAQGGFTTATDLADYLVSRGMPFRNAHQVVGRMVRSCIDRGIGLADMDLEEMRSFSDLIAEDVVDVLSVRTSVIRRDTPGGTSPDRVEDALREAREHLESIRRGN